MRYNPDSMKTANPQSYPQWPFNPGDEPKHAERSLPRYGVRVELDQRVKMRDGVHLAIDVQRPAGRPGETFPALVGFSPYTRQLQRSNVPIGQNEAGIPEFWVPRGYALVTVDVRGSNDSEGSWDMYGPTERADFAEVIEWVAEQAWCSGRVGMLGASYFGRTQLMAAEEKPPSLKAIFAYDAATDAYRDTFYHGGIPNEGMQRNWFSSVRMLNSFSGRQPNLQAIEDRIVSVASGDNAFDSPSWHERSTWPRLGEIEIPVYFGCHWSFFNLHLRGAFEGWYGTGNIPKRMLIGPTPTPRRPFADYHQEMLRWYDAWLKDYDTMVLDGPPIQLWIPGDDTWRGELDWPLSRTEWRKLHLSSPKGEAGADGLSWSRGSQAERSYTSDSQSDDWLLGRPRVAYRTEPFDVATEITGPIQLDLELASSATDTDVFVALYEEEASDRRKLLTRGWLRASHRAVDAGRSRENRPWHVHTRESVKPLEPGVSEKLQVEVIPTSNVFSEGTRLVLEIASSDSLPDNMTWYHRGIMNSATNVIIEEGSSLSVPVIPKDQH